MQFKRNSGPEKLLSRQITSVKDFLTEQNRIVTENSLNYACKRGRFNFGSVGTMEIKIVELNI